MSDQIAVSKAPFTPQSGKQRSDEFHKRAGKSQAEARKLLTGLAAASVGFLYSSLTGDKAPPFTSPNYTLSLLALLAMAISTILGLCAWWAEAKWAYEAAKKFEATIADGVDATGVPPHAGRWHTIKLRSEATQSICFGLGISTAAFVPFLPIWLAAASTP